MANRDDGAVAVTPALSTSCAFLPAPLDTGDGRVDRATRQQPIQAEGRIKPTNDIAPSMQTHTRYPSLNVIHQKTTSLLLVSGTSVRRSNYLALIGAK